MIRRILVPLDGSPLAEQALSAARRLARETTASLLLVRAVGSFAEAAARRAAISAAAEYLQSVEQRLTGEGFATGAVVLPHEPAQAILFAAEIPGADVIAMCTHGRTGLGRVLVGSVAEAVLAQATIPVLMVPASAEPRQRHTELLGTILVPLDGSAHAETALAYLLQTPLASRARVTLLRVVEPPPAPRQPLAIEFADIPRHARAELETNRQRQEAERHLRRLGSTSLRAGSWQARVTLGDPATEIVEMAKLEAVDLIVMATHGRHGLARLVHGSVAGEVLRHAEVPVLIVAGVTPALGTRAEEERVTPDEAAGEPISRGQHSAEGTGG